MKPTAVLVDDDSLARRRLEDLVSEVASVEIVGEAADGEAAVRLIDELKPDLAFLSVELPGGSGVEVLERVQHTPAVIFTSADHGYAVPAFALSAVDYLAKPFDAVRLREALERAHATLERAGVSPEAHAPPLEESGPLETPLARLFLRERDTILPMAVQRITRFEADGDYVWVHADDRSHMVRRRLQELERSLGDRFLRVHRAHLVNLDHVKLFEYQQDARLVVVMADGTRILASRARSRALRRLAR